MVLSGRYLWVGMLVLDRGRTLRRPALSIIRLILSTTEIDLAAHQVDDPRAEYKMDERPDLDQGPPRCTVGPHRGATKVSIVQEPICHVDRRRSVGPVAGAPLRGAGVRIE